MQTSSHFNKFLLKINDCVEELFANYICLLFKLDGILRVCCICAILWSQNCFSCGDTLLWSSSPLFGSLLDSPDEWATAPVPYPPTPHNPTCIIKFESAVDLGLRLSTHGKSRIIFSWSRIFLKHLIRVMVTHKEAVIYGSIKSSIDGNE